MGNSPRNARKFLQIIEVDKTHWNYLMIIMGNNLSVTNNELRVNRLLLSAVLEKKEEEGHDGATSQILCLVLGLPLQEGH